MDLFGCMDVNPPTTNQKKDYQPASSYKLPVGDDSSTVKIHSSNRFLLAITNDKFDSCDSFDYFTATPRLLPRLPCLPRLPHNDVRKRNRPTISNA